MAISPGEVTLLLGKLKHGNQDALGELIPIVYKELRRVAGNCLRDERIGHTLQPTALVHEVYLRLVGQQRADWQNRAQFIGVAREKVPGELHRFFDEACGSDDSLRRPVALKVNWQIPKAVNGLLGRPERHRL